MRKFLFPLFILFSSTILSQNGFFAYYNITSSHQINSAPTGTVPILIDNNGNKWMGYNNGTSYTTALISKYDSTTWYWTYYDRTNTPVLPATTVKCICTDNANTIWFGTTAGLIKYDGSNFSLLTIAD